MKLFIALITLIVFSVHISAQTSAFTYQGWLTDTNAAASGTFEMRFRLYDALTGGAQQPASGPITLDFTMANGNPVTVTNGIFTVQLDFTAAPFIRLSTAERFLEISVRHNATESFTPLDPRQRITSAPISIRAEDTGKIQGVRVSGASPGPNMILKYNSGTQEWEPAPDTTSGTVTSVQTNNGLVGGPITTSGTIGIENGGVLTVAHGGTGSSTKNFVDLTTNQTVAGTKNFTGVITGDGSNLTGTVGVFTFSGFVDNIAGNSIVYVFAGPTAAVTIATGQRLTGSASAVLARGATNTGAADIGLCYQPSSGGTVINFSGINYLSPNVGSTKQPYAVSYGINPGAGSYNVGFCVRNTSASALSNNDFVNGWVMVTRN